MRNFYCFRHRLIALCLGSLFLCTSPAARAGGPLAMENALAELSLEELLQLKVAVTSMVERPVREAPGVVSVITREEIENSGARNLDDLLVFVPGITPGQDEQNARGYGVRGLWATEGKMLVLLDGVRLNEPLYGNTVFAHQFTADLIERIEVIRGPASAVFGEFGELAVVNIVSRGATEQGGTVSGTFGQAADVHNRRSLSAGWWGRIHGASVSVSGTAGEGHLGNGDYTDKYGERILLKRFNGQDFWTVNSGVGYKRLNLRFIASSLHQKNHITGGFDAAGNLLPGLSKPLLTTFDSYDLDARYSWPVRADLTITPHFAYRRSYSWQKNQEWVFRAIADPSDAGEFFRDFPDTRYRTGASAVWEPASSMTLVLGGEWSQETIEARLPSEPSFDPWEYYYFYGPDSSEVSSTVRSFFTEFSLRTSAADLTVGMRYDKNSRFPAARLPRVALTRRWGDYYVKGMASRAYHPPTLMTISWLDPELRPEYAWDYEAEAGYQPSPNTLFRVNAFAIDMKPVIFYSGNFSNSTVRSRGLEAEARFKNRRGSLNLAYSLYRAHYDDRENAMAEDETGAAIREVTLGFPTHKVTLTTSLKVLGEVTVSPGLVWYSRRYVRKSSWFWDGTDSDYTPVNWVLDPAVLANLYVRSPLAAGWDVGLGVFNLFDEEYSSVTGSYVGNPPVPGPSRELVLRAAYRF